MKSRNPMAALTTVVPAHRLKTKANSPIAVLLCMAGLPALPTGPAGRIASVVVFFIHVLLPLCEIDHSNRSLEAGLFPAARAAPSWESRIPLSGPGVPGTSFTTAATGGIARTAVSNLFTQPSLRWMDAGHVPVHRVLRPAGFGPHPALTVTASYPSRVSVRQIRSPSPSFGTGLGPVAFPIRGIQQENANVDMLPTVTTDDLLGDLRFRCPWRPRPCGAAVPPRGSPVSRRVRMAAGL